MLKQRMQEAINNQIQKEIQSAYLYLSMEAYCQTLDLDGFANFFRVQFKEELDHAMKFYDYVNSTGGAVILQAIEQPQISFKSPLDVFKTGLEHEQYVTELINNLAKIANEENDYATASFLQWFINEQVEEMNNFNKYVKKLSLAGSDPTALFMINTELGQRVYTPIPTTQN